MKYLVLTGRILFSFIFLMTITSHFSDGAIAYARSKEVPAAAFLVPFSGVLAFSGALSIIFGFKAKWGAWLIIIFLVPVTLLMHDFWNMQTPAEKEMQMTQFLKNTSMLGAAFLIAYFGSGPMSIDAKINSEKEVKVNFKQ